MWTRHKSSLDLFAENRRVFKQQDPEVLAKAIQAAEAAQAVADGEGVIDVAAKATGKDLDRLKSALLSIITGKDIEGNALIVIAELGKMLSAESLNMNEEEWGDWMLALDWAIMIYNFNKGNFATGMRQFLTIIKEPQNLNRIANTLAMKVHPVAAFSEQFRGMFEDGGRDIFDKVAGGKETISVFGKEFTRDEFATMTADICLFAAQGQSKIFIKGTEIAVAGYEKVLDMVGSSSTVLTLKDLYDKIPPELRPHLKDALAKVAEDLMNGKSMDQVLADLMSHEQVLALATKEHEELAAVVKLLLN